MNGLRTIDLTMYYIDLWLGTCLYTRLETNVSSVLKYRGYSGLEVCQMKISGLRLLEFVINRIFMKAFKTNAINTVKHCRDKNFDFDLHSVMIEKRKKDICVTI